jgi:hypothetical protein
MKKLLFTLMLFVASIAFAQTQVGQSETVFINTKITLSAVAEGTTPVAFQWYKDGVLLSTNVTTSANQTSYTNDVYTINSVQLTSAGIYKVVATNLAGTAESPTVTLITMVPVGPNSIKIFIKRG